MLQACYNFVVIPFQMNRTKLIGVIKIIFGIHFMFEKATPNLYINLGSLLFDL